MPKHERNTVFSITSFGFDLSRVLLENFFKYLYLIQILHRSSQGCCHGWYGVMSCCPLWVPVVLVSADLSSVHFVVLLPAHLHFMFNRYKACSVITFHLRIDSGFRCEGYFDQHLRRCLYYVYETIQERWATLWTNFYHGIVLPTVFSALLNC